MDCHDTVALGFRNEFLTEPTKIHLMTQVTAENLKSVQFGSTAWFNDQIVSNVLAKWGSQYHCHASNIIRCCRRNALKQIEEIRILRSYELSMSAVQQLIDACPRLR